jgi:uncharacterized protein (TIGR02145 family)
MKKVFFILSLFTLIYSCTKKESTPTVTPPVVIKLSSCDSIKQGLLKTTSDTVRLLSCVSITGCDSVRLGLLKSSTDLLRLNCNSSSITIGTQKWMIVNLDVVTYRNGDVIPQVTDSTAWGQLTTGAWCYYNNDPANGLIYGKLYNWYAVNDSRGLVPQGWHISTNAEWITLSTFLGGDDIAGGKLKEVGTNKSWISPNTNATNESGFSALPGGNRSTEGKFGQVGNYGYWWTATQTNSAGAWFRSLVYVNGKLTGGNGINRHGFSVRCVRD